jgi:hypothetical protein
MVCSATGFKQGRFEVIPVYRTVGVAIMGAGLMAVSPVPPLGPDLGVRVDAVRLVDTQNPALDAETVALIAGGTNDQLPPPSVVHRADELYIQPNFPDAHAQPLFLPDQTYTIATPYHLGEDTSIALGVENMNFNINQQLAQGHHAVVWGVSQGTQVEGHAMPQLAQEGVPSSDLSFIMTGAPMNPNGGFFERFDGLHIPSIDQTFDGAFPTNLYPTTVWTVEYDGFADWPQYPLNVLSDINAIMGLTQAHPEYLQLTPEQLDHAIELPTQGDTMSTFYMVPFAGLPLTNALRDVPVVGKPLADLLEPVLKPLVNLGYGDPDFGWSQGPANVPTEIGVFPEPDMVLKALQEAAAGIPVGIQAATNDLESLDLSSLLPDLSSMLTSDSLAGLSAADMAAVADPASVLSNITDTLSHAISTTTGALNAMSNFLLPLVLNLPAYDAQLFAEGLETGNLVDAIGRPFAANTGIDLFDAYEFQVGFEVIGNEVSNDLTQLGHELSSLIGI